MHGRQERKTCSITTPYFPSSAHTLAYVQKHTAHFCIELEPMYIASLGQSIDTSLQSSSSTSSSFVTEIRTSLINSPLSISFMRCCSSRLSCWHSAFCSRRLPLPLRFCGRESYKMRVQNNKMYGWDWVKVWIPKSEKLGSKCISNSKETSRPCTKKIHITGLENLDWKFNCMQLFFPFFFFFFWAFFFSKWKITKVKNPYSMLKLEKFQEIKKGWHLSNTSKQQTACTISIIITAFKILYQAVWDGW